VGRFLEAAADDAVTRAMTEFKEEAEPVSVAAHRNDVADYGRFAHGCTAAQIRAHWATFDDSAIRRRLEPAFSNARIEPPEEAPTWPSF
jgi:hypothetical protein